jgi:hypothetical protein
VDGGGRKVVERKEEIKKRLGYSPDLADGVNLAFTQAGPWYQDRDTLEYLRDRMLGAPR